MNPPAVLPAPPLLHQRPAAAWAILPLLGLLAWGVVRFFLLGSEATALRQVAMSSAPEAWNKRFAIHVGSMTTGAVRAGAWMFNLPPEPRAAIAALHQGEVGIYRLEEDVPLDRAAILRAADKAMASRGWVRIVGVLEPQQLVAIYCPRKAISASRMKCCLLVSNERDLIVASAGGDLAPLLEIATGSGGKVRAFGHSI